MRFAAKVLTGLPSILAGVFAYGAVVLDHRRILRAWPAALRSRILMLPTVMLTAEEAIRMVPARMKEAAIGMGATPTQIVWIVLLPTADARVSSPASCWPLPAPPVKPRRCSSPPCSATTGSELTAGLQLMQPTASLAVLIYNFAGMPFENQIELAWAAVAGPGVCWCWQLNMIGQTSLAARFNNA